MSSKPVSLIFGAGANVGSALVKKFIQAGYRVATVSRSAPETAAPSDDGSRIAIRADLSQPDHIPTVFKIIHETWGASPKIVVWNAANVTPSPDQDNIFSIPVSAIEKDLAITVTSPFVAAGEAVRGWKSTGVEGRFIMTGNIQPKVVFPVADFTTLSIAKSGAAYWIGTADALYKSKNWRFFFAEERTSEGQPMGFVPGAESHATMFLHLAEGKEDLPSYITFVDGQYHTF
ncbi:NAD(P)-binding protein [Thozetella sp. PMI_491]|nr:NAD(P)-binding protein [Thozetella sp. PMI_491]